MQRQGVQPTECAKLVRQGRQLRAGGGQEEEPIKSEVQAEVCLFEGVLWLWALQGKKSHIHTHMQINVQSEETGWHRRNTEQAAAPPAPKNPHTRTWLM